MKRMWFWIKYDWQSTLRTPTMTACGVGGKRVILSFNFSHNFFQKHGVIVQSQKRYVIFLPKELQKK